MVRLFLATVQQLVFESETPLHAKNLIQEMNVMVCYSLADLEKDFIVEESERAIAS